MEKRVTSLRLPEELLVQVEDIARWEHKDRGTVLRELIEESIKLRKMKNAILRYREGKVSLWRAAEEAGVSYVEMLEELRKEGITFRYDIEDLAREVE